MIHLLLTNFPNALRPVSDAVVEFCNKTLDSCLGNSQISDGKAETTNFASYTFSYPASPLSQSQLSSISNTMLTAAAMKRGFDATIISKTIKSFTNRADAVLDLFVNDEWLALQTDSQIGSLAASFSRVMTIVADCLIWASKFHSSVCVNDFKFILSKFAKAMDNVKQRSRQRKEETDLHLYILST